MNQGMQRWGWVGVGVGFLGLAIAPAIAQPIPPPNALLPPVQAVVKHLVGTMDTSAQAARNPKVSNIRMTTCQIKVQPESSPQALYLYQEQAASQRLNQPYRQRFLEISLVFDGKAVRSRAFRPQNPATWINFCQRPEAQRSVAIADLGQPVCSVFLKRSEDEYVGVTPAQGCPANYKGAVRITNRIVLHSTGMDTWDQGFDQAGKQVWGAESEAYQFRWVQP